ncbi:MAG: hypothetical protein HY042_02040 [Spirochaetia bacterium]|nr:hypothetical protein [Spirochaetia bacterium]
MENYVIKGILKKNTRGRCYLVYQERGLRKIVALAGPVARPGGETVTVVGHFLDSRFVPVDVIPADFPVRRAARGI